MKEKTRVAAYGLIRREEEIVLCRISPHITSAAGQWTLPGGGVEFGEDPKDAVIREVKEETGLDVKPLEIVAVDSLCHPVNTTLYHSIRLIYRTELIGGTALTDEIDGTTDQCRWWAQSHAVELPLVTLAQRGISLAFD